MSAQDVSEALAEQEVDEEVDGRVEDLECVGDVDEVVDELGAVLVLVPPHDLHDPRRRLAQHEDDDDNDHDERDVVLVVTPTTRHSPSSLLRRAVRNNDLCVDEGQNEQWQDE